MEKEPRLHSCFKNVLKSIAPKDCRAAQLKNCEQWVAANHFKGLQPSSHILQPAYILSLLPSFYVILLLPIASFSVIVGSLMDIVRNSEVLFRIRYISRKSCNGTS